MGYFYQGNLTDEESLELPKLNKLSDYSLFGGQTESALPTFSIMGEGNVPNLAAQKTPVAPHPTQAEAPRVSPYDNLNSKMGLGNLNVGQFARLAGMAASAIDPNSPMGRMGAGVANIAAEGERYNAAFSEREQDRLDQNKKYEALLREKRMNNYMTMLSKKEVNPLLKQKIWAGYAADWNKEYPDVKLDPEMPMQSDNAAEFTKFVSEIGANKDIKPADKKQAIVIKGMELGVITPIEGIKEFTQAPSTQAHNVIEIPSPDGKTAQKYQYNTENNRYDIPIGKPYSVKSQVISPLAQLPSDEIDILADMLYDGRIDASDLSKRGGNTQIAAIFKRAEERHPGFDPRGNKAENASYQATLIQQQKQRGAVGSFVKNIDEQIKTVNDIFKHLQRTNVRALNIPFREVRTRLIGSGLENKYDMFLSEISAESSKLSQSAAQSIAQLPEGSREKWEKIHDLNLSIPEMKKLLEGTSHMGKIRLKSLDDEIVDTIKRRKTHIQDKQVGPKNEEQVDKLPDFDVKGIAPTKKGQKLTNPDIAKKLLTAANGDKKVARQMATKLGWVW